jgi:hypothetical protein
MVKVQRAFVVFAAACFVFALPAAGLGWTYGTSVHMTINGHQFHRVAVENDGCKLNLTLKFEAPEKGYDSKSKVRNYHRFQARLLFKNGKDVKTQVFANDQPGKRMIRLVHDSEHEACWGKEKVELKDVDVVGCRGKKCKLESFARVTPEFSN